MKKIYITTLMLIGLTVSSFAQTGNVGIGTNTPSSSAKLDIDVTSDATKSGLLIPRVALTSTTDASTIPTPATSLLIYNTATAGAAPNNVTPGYYYNAGTSASPNWVRMITKADNGWTVANTTATPAGKTDNQYVTGKVGIGDYSATNPTMQLEVKSATTTTDQTAILGQSTGTTGKVYGVLGTTASTTANASGVKGIATGSTGNTNGVWGQSNSTTGSGVYGVNNGTTTGFGVFGEASTGNAVRGETSTGTGVVGSANGANGYGVFGQSIGSGGTNYGGYFTAINGTNNYGLVVANGNAGVGTITPKEKLQVAGNTLVDNNVIAGQGIVTGKIERKVGPPTTTDNAWHTVELSDGFGGTAISAYATGSYLDGDIKIQGVDITALLSTTTAWYTTDNSSSWKSISSSKGTGTTAPTTVPNCNNCAYQVYCPDGYIVTGWQAWANNQLDHNLRVRCTSLNSDYETVETNEGIESVTNFPNADYNNIVHVASCPAGTFIKGISVYVSSYLDNNFRVNCTGIKRN